MQKSAFGEGTIQYAVQNRVATLTLYREPVHNAVNFDMMQGLSSALDQIESSPEIAAIIITGAGNKTFCAGGDIRYFATLNSREACLEMSRKMQGVLNRLYRGKRPVIAAVNGQALGGGIELLSATHLRFAIPEARFAFRQAPNGISTGWGGGERLFAQANKVRLLEKLLCGDFFSAEEALDLGILNGLCQPGSLLRHCQEVAEKIIKNPGPSIQTFLKMFTNSDVNSEWETELFASLWMGQDFRQFIQKYTKPGEGKS